MSGELSKKLNQLKKLINEKSNKEFKKNAVEFVKSDKLDEAEIVNDAERVERRIIARPYIQRRLTEMMAITIDNMQEILATAQAFGDELYPELTDLFNEFAREEVARLSAINTALELFGMRDIDSEIEGRRKAFRILAGRVFEANDFQKKENELQELADKVRKSFDFVGEYTKNKVEYNKEKIADVLNDLIAGKKDLESAVEVIIKDGKKIIGKKDTKINKKGEKKDENDNV